MSRNHPTSIPTAAREGREPIQGENLRTSQRGGLLVSAIQVIQRSRKVWILVGCGLLVSGCAFLPSTGPSTERIDSKAGQLKEPDPYQLITITGDIVIALQKSEANTTESGLSTLASGPATQTKMESLFRVTGMSGLPLPVRQTVEPGDVVNVTIYEAGGGLFGPLVPGDSQNTHGVGVLPAQIVDQSGQITVPYAGRVQATGRTTFEIEQEIVSKLKNKAIEPQAIVTISDRKGGNVVTVTGDVKTPSLVPIPQAGLRLLDAVTAASGSLGDAHETNVTVIRGADARTDLLADVLSHVQKNISLQASDTVVLRNRPWSYLAFGAIMKPGSFPFGKADMSLADAMAYSGGALDDRARPTIYLYRLEPTAFVKQMGLKPLNKNTTNTPVIYQLDLRTPQGFFLAQRFPVRNQDILYFSNASSVGVLKLFGLINAITAPARTGLTTGIGTATGLNNINN